MACKGLNGRRTSKIAQTINTRLDLGDREGGSPRGACRESMQNLTLEMPPFQCWGYRVVVHK